MIQHNLLQAIFVGGSVLMGKLQYSKMGFEPIQKWQTRGNSVFCGRCWAYKRGTNGDKKWHFGCPNENSKTTFISRTSPKKDKIAFRFKRHKLPLWNSNIQYLSKLPPS